MQQAYFPDPIAYWLAFVERKGGLPAVVGLTGVPYSTLACISNGHRGIGRKLAARLQAATGGELDASRLVWVTPTKTKQAA